MADPVIAPPHDSMAENYSHLQKLCLDIIYSGAVGAFIEFFRFTHMEQPLGNNQPYSYEDLIGTAGSEAPQLAPLFSFDSPLGMPLDQLYVIQTLLQYADSACLENDLYTYFKALSSISDTFLENHKLRLRVKMLPLVTPYPVYTQLLETKQNQILKLIDAPEFQHQIVDQDALIAAVAKLKNEEIRTQTFAPIVIQYALKARNCVFQYIYQEIRDYDAAPLLSFAPDAEFPERSDVASILPQELLSRSLLLLLTAYLRLAISLQIFNLFKPAYRVFQLFLQTAQKVEELEHIEQFEPTVENGYKMILSDEHINMQQDKKDDNLAYASLELSQVPRLYDTILDRKRIFCEWDVTKDEDDGLVGGRKYLSEFIYAGRMMSIMNNIYLACQIFTYYAKYLSDIDIDLSEIDRAYQTKCGAAGTDAVLTKSYLDYYGELPDTVKCSYLEFLFSTSLLKQALQQSLDYYIYSTTLPAFKRFAELTSLTNLYALAEPYSQKIRQQNSIFNINGLAWEARWARLENNDQKRMELLNERLRVSQEACYEDANNVKYAVSAASELVFSKSGHDINKMEEAWKSLQGGAHKEINNTIIEARVRYGAVKGAEKVEKGMSDKERKVGVEEGHDEDLDDVVTDA